MNPNAPKERDPLITRFITFAGLIKRPMTLGVRGLVIDAAGKVLLVRHTYVAGYFLPGGGVEGGETMVEALTRELAKEGNIELLEPPRLGEIYLNLAASPRDHVALYIVRGFRQTAPFEPNFEIAEAGFFAPDALPETTTRATRARLNEALEGVEASAYW